MPVTRSALWIVCDIHSLCNVYIWSMYASALVPYAHLKLSTTHQWQFHVCRRGDLLYVLMPTESNTHIFTVHCWLLLRLNLCASCISNMSGANPLHPTPSSIMRCTPCGNTLVHPTWYMYQVLNQWRPYICSHIVSNVLSYNFPVMVRFVKHLAKYPGNTRSVNYLRTA